MLLVVTISTTQFQQLDKRWARFEALKRKNAIKAFGTLNRERDMPGGLVLLVDWRRRSVVKSVKVPQASGVIAYKDSLLVSANNKIWSLSRGLKRDGYVSHRLFNNLHGLAWDGGSRLAVAASGIDSVLFLDPDRDVNRYWYAVERGFPNNALGEPRHLDLNEDHRAITYSTLHHTTHVNSLLWTRAGAKLRLRLWATFFHQGGVFSIHSRGATRILGGLHAPHGLVSDGNGGYAVADTAGRRIVEFRVDGNDVTERHDIPLPECDWIQDIEPLGDGYLVADCNNCRILEVDRAGKVRGSWTYNRDWKIQELMLLA